MANDPTRHLTQSATFPLMAASPSGFAQRGFCVVIPMYNEESGAANCVDQVTAALANIRSRTTLIIINDGSADHTGAILETAAHRYSNLIVINHSGNQGYGAALRTGVAAAAKAGFEYVLFMDSDLTNHPEDIPLFEARMAEDFDVIKATRYSRGGSVSGIPLYRAAISRIGNLVARVLFGLPIHDCTNGYRAVKVDLLTRMHLIENRFAIIMEELYWCKFLARNYAEVPVTLTNRANNQRATSFVYRPAVFWNYLKYPLRALLRIPPTAGEHK